jgi:choline kinase
VAIILAAGYGRRLADSHDGPKVLLEFDGVSLLERRLKTLEAGGVGAVSITVGYDAERIRQAVARIAPNMAVGFVENPRYREGSLLSLLVQKAVLQSGRPVLVMDGDVLHDRRMIERLLEAKGEVVLLVDPELEPGDEPVKVCFRGETRSRNTSTTGTVNPSASSAFRRPWPRVCRTNARPWRTQAAACSNMKKRSAT